MYTRRLISVLTSSLLFALVTTAQTVGGGNGVYGNEAAGVRFVGGREEGKDNSNQPAQKGSLPESSVIIVNGRTLTGPNSAAQQRGARLFLPVASIAHALGDVLQSDATSRIVSVRHQNGTVTDFSAQLNQVRENGSVTLAVSGTADIVFPPDPQELMLPAEIVAALLDISIRRDEGRAINITRGQGPAQTVRAGPQHAPWELFQIEYDYNLSRYSSFSGHNLVLRGSGRLADSRVTFLTNFVGGGVPSLLTGFRGGNLRLERPNGQTFVAGDFGTGTDLQFMSATVRGGSAELPVGGVRLNTFAGRSISGIPNLVPLEDSGLPVPDLLEQSQPRLGQLHFDTDIVGAYVTAGSYAKGPNRRDLLFSSGVMHFSGPSRRGDMLAGSVRFAKGRSRFQADLGAGEFSGRNRDNVRVDGAGAALNLSGSLQLNDQLIVQGRYAYVGPNFLSAQSGLQDPINLTAGGVTWQPKEWVTASLSGNTATSPGKAGDFNRFVTSTLNLTPSGQWPTMLFSHTQSGTPQLKNAAFTLASAAKQFSRWRLFMNATRVKTFGPATLNALAGASVQLNESNTIEVSQLAGSRDLFSGNAAWQMSNVLGKYLNISGGLGYMRSGTSPLRTTESLSASLRLPRQNTLQFSYVQTQTGPTMLLSLRGLLLSSPRAERAMNGPLAEVNSYSAVHGRVYQDVNLNGQFDPGIDQPTANVKVRVDGNRYVLTGPDGNYHLDAVPMGEHAIYLDLLTVRADLTLLDGSQQQVSLDSKRDSVVDFRLVRAGRISGMVWLDLNGNGQLDEGEQAVADVRVVTGSGRDTLTDGNGHFMIGDLPPGEHVILVDDKTLPNQTLSVRGSLSVKVLVGSETGDVVFPVTALPPEVKRFPGN
ncbi:MAG: hypothetical protein AABN95_00375 [Acidobacteriota bacterium]